MGSAIGTAAAATSSGGSSTFLILIVVFIGLIYFMAIRPGRNRQKRVQQQQNNVLPGARVRTTAGMYATVVAVDGDDVVLEVAPDVEVRYMKRAIMEVLSPGDEVPAEDQAETDGAEAEYEDDADAEHEPDLSAPAGQYGGDDLVINGQRDAAGNGTAAPSVNGEHGDTKPESATTTD
jgi:preprotein translocase subunit YajC